MTPTSDQSSFTRAEPAGGEASSEDRPFAFGSQCWPGLAKLIEECGEVTQVCGKLMMTGGSASHWDGSNLTARLTEEIADAAAALRFVATYGLLDLGVIDARSDAKFALFEQWHADQIALPEVEPQGSSQSPMDHHGTGDRQLAEQASAQPHTTEKVTP